MSPLILDSEHASPRRRANTHAFIVSGAKFEDIRRLVDIEFYAFENEKTNHILSYRDHKKPAHFERSVKSYQTAIAAASSPRRTKSVAKRCPDVDLDTPTTTFRKVTDTDSGVLISWAKTEMVAYTLEDLASPADVGHEEDPVMNRDWFALNERSRREYMGTAKHCYIGMLATQPSYQHHGAGTMLLEDILAEADDAGVECYLEATDTAKPLYERHGFHTVGEIRFDPSGYGVYGYKPERQTIMVRGALSADGMRRNEVRAWDVAVREAQTHVDAAC